MNAQRWTVTSEETCMQMRKKRLRPSVVARCFCGREAVVWLDDLRYGRTHGCRSRRCQAAFEAYSSACAAIATWARGEEAVHPLDALDDVELESREAIAADLRQRLLMFFRERLNEGEGGKT